MRGFTSLGVPLLGALLAAMVALSAGPAAALVPGVEVGPAPAWAEPFEEPQPMAGENPQGEGIAYLVYHRQVAVGRGEPEKVVHVAEQILNTAGLQRTTKVDVDFDPSYESLTLHFIRVRRGGSVVDRLDLADLRVVQREDDLERQIYDGTKTVVQFLGDVRVGDVVEYAYTIRGANPVFRGHLSESFRTSFAAAVRHLRFRLLVRDGRAVHVRAHGLEVSPRQLAGPSGREWIWDLRDVKALEEEDEVPSWEDVYPWVQVSDFASWADVEEWARGLYGQPPAKGAEIDSVVRRCAGAGAPADRALCAIRFVQDEIRYLGLEVGPNSHQPHDPAEVLAHRFGDCKDKALLLVVLLRRLGFTAEPALVSTTAGRALDGWLPTPGAFDHVIVKLTTPIREGLGPLFVDATQALQGGDLATMTPAVYERCLVIGGGVVGLEKMPDPMAVGSEREEEHFNVHGDGSATLEVTTTWTEGEADWRRYESADTALGDLQRQYLNYYADSFTGIESGGDMERRDDRAANRFVEVEHYEIPHFWSRGGRTLFAHLISSRAPEKPRLQIRKHSLAVDHPVTLVHVITVELPKAPRLTPEHVVVDGEGFRFERWRAVSGRKVTARFRYESREDAVAPARVKAHLASLRRMRRNLALELDVAAVGGPSLAGSGPLLRGLGALMLVGLGLFGAAVGVRAGRRQWRRRRFQARVKMKPGDGPEQPLDVVSEDDARGRLQPPRCSCPGASRFGDTLHDTIIMGGKTIHVLALGCAECGAEARLYYRIRGE